MVLSGPDHSAIKHRHHPFANPEGRFLLVGFGLSTCLYVGVLGLRWPVLLTAPLPPLGALALWHRVQPRRRQSSPSTSLLDAPVLQQRLQLEGELTQLALDQWCRITDRLEAVRALAAQCTDLDDGCSVPLLVLLERLVDQARSVEPDLRRLSTGSNRRDLARHGRRAMDLQEQLQVCLDALGRCHDAALDDAMRWPDVPPTVLLTPQLLDR